MNHIAVITQKGICKEIYCITKSTEEYNLYYLKKYILTLHTVDNSSNHKLCINILKEKATYEQVESIIAPFKFVINTDTNNRVFPNIYNETFYDTTSGSSSSSCRSVTIFQVKNDICDEKVNKLISEIDNINNHMLTILQDINISMIYTVFLEFYIITLRDRIDEIKQLIINDSIISAICKDFNSKIANNLELLQVALIDKYELSAIFAWANTLTTKYLVKNGYSTLEAAYIIYILHKNKNNICSEIYDILEIEAYLPNIYTEIYYKEKKSRSSKSTPVKITTIYGNTLESIPSLKKKYIIDIDILYKSIVYNTNIKECIIKNVTKESLQSIRSIIHENPAYVLTTESLEYFDIHMVRAVQMIDIRYMKISKHILKHSLLYTKPFKQLVNNNKDLLNNIADKYESDEDDYNIKNILLTCASALSISITTKPSLNRISQMIKEEIRRKAIDNTVLQISEELSPRKRNVLFGTNRVQIIPNRYQNS